RRWPAPAHPFPEGGYPRTRDRTDRPRLRRPLRRGRPRRMVPPGRALHARSRRGLPADHTAPATGAQPDRPRRRRQHRAGDRRLESPRHLTPSAVALPRSGAARPVCSLTMDLAAIFTAENLTALITLTAMEIVLGIDNIVFIAILTL